MLAMSWVRVTLLRISAMTPSSWRGGTSVAARRERNLATARSDHRADPVATSSSMTEAAANEWKTDS
jgi:hypothetical protein